MIIQILIGVAGFMTLMILFVLIQLRKTQTELKKAIRRIQNAETETESNNSKHSSRISSLNLRLAEHQIEFDEEKEIRMKDAIQLDRISELLQPMLDEQDRTKLLVAEKERAERQKKELMGLASLMRGIQINLRCRADKDGNLYGKVQARHIVDCMKDSNILLAEYDIVLPHPITKVGKHYFCVRLHQEIPEITIPINVIKIN